MWAGVCDWDLTASCLGDFPYECNVPGASRLTITQDNLWDVVSSLDVPGIEALFVADPRYLVTNWAASVTSRYAYCSEFNCPAYEGAYDDQPNWWVSAVAVIKHARQQASDWRTKHG